MNIRKEIIATIAIVLLSTVLASTAVAAYDVTIISGLSSGGSWSGGSPNIWTPDADNSEVSVSDLLNNLSIDNVVITTGSGDAQSGNITVISPIDYSGVGARTLDLQAANDIVVNSAITGNNLTLIMRSFGNSNVNSELFVGSIFFQIGSGHISINCPSIVTTGDQRYNGAVTLGSDTSFESAAGSVAFTSSLDSDFTPRSVSVNASNAASFGGAVGSSASISNLDVTAGSGIHIDGGAVVTTGTQNYINAVMLGSDTSFESAAGSVAFTSSLDSDFTPRNVSVNASNAASFGGAVGSSASISNLDVTAGTAATLHGGVLSGSLTVNSDSAVFGSGMLSVGTAAAITATTTIGNSAGAGLLVNGNASFGQASIDLGTRAGDTMQFGSLTFNSPGTVQIAVDTEMNLAGVSSAGTFSLTPAATLANPTPTVFVESGAILDGAGLVNGLLNVKVGGTVRPGGSGNKTLTVTRSPVLAGTVAMKLSKSGAALTSDRLIVNGNPLAYGGTLTVTAVGDVPVRGDRFYLFDAAGPFSGAFSTLNLPDLPVGLEWNVNGLGVDGTIFVQLKPTFGISSVIADGARVYAADDGEGIWKSTNGGATWTAANSQPANQRVKGLVIHPATRSTLLAATYGGGAYTSTDSGATWNTCANGGLSGSSLNAVSLAIDSSGVLYAGTEGGIFKSSDCSSWSAINNGLTVDAAIPPVAIAIDSATPATLYTGLDGAGVYRSSDSGASWAPATTQPTNLRIKALVITPGDSTKLYAATYGGGVYQSANSGVDWSACANTNLTSLNVVSLTIDGNGKLYAGSEVGVFVSNDYCASWNALNTGLPL
jgi:hypothetical protein